MKEKTKLMGYIKKISKKNKIEWSSKFQAMIEYSTIIEKHIDEIEVRIPK